MTHPTIANTTRKQTRAFDDFVERNGYPVHWARYHLACLKATRASDKSLPLDKAKQLRMQALELLQTTVNELSEYKSDKGPYQRDLMVRLLSVPLPLNRKPGEPVACQHLVQAWVEKHGSAASLVAQLQQK